MKNYNKTQQKNTILSVSTYVLTYSGGGKRRVTMKKRNKTQQLPK